MFGVLGFSDHWREVGNRLTVYNPASLWFVLVCALVLRYLVRTRGRVTTRAWRIAWTVTFVFFFIFLALGFTPARVILDAEQNKAEIKTVTLFIPRTRTMPLADVSGAFVGDTDLTEALSLRFANGKTIQLSGFNQTSGTDEAAEAINKFLREHRAGSTKQ